MTRTHVLADYADVVPDRALAFERRDDGSYRTDVSRWLQTGDGAVFSTVEELLLWDRNFYDPRVGGAGLLTELHRQGRLTSGRELDYASGLMVGTNRGLRTVMHGGAWGGYRAELLRYPDERTSVAVLCNLASSDPTRLAFEVAEIYLEDRMQPAAARPGAPAAASEAPATANSVALDAARLQALAGIYRNPETRLGRTITAEAGKLYVGSGTRYELRPRSATEFDVIGLPAAVSVTFHAPAADRPARLVWTQNGEQQTFERLELVTPAAGELAAYAGDYFSEELNATFSLSVVDGALTLRRPLTDPAPLRPLTRDEFSTPGATLRFVRDASGAVTGFFLDVGRVRNLRFARAAR